MSIAEAAATFSLPCQANIFTYFGQSNTTGQIIVILLVACSLVAWTLMIDKTAQLRRFNRQNTTFQKRLYGSALLALTPKRLAGLGPYAMCLSRVLEALIEERDAGAAVGRAMMGRVENALQRAVAEQTLHYEARMVMLGSIVTGAPFLGLLGTVWGVMDAFGALAGQASASIGSLAPGVSGALLTTVAGLVVAIPSVFGYNFLLDQNRRLITELENFASTLADRLERELIAAESPESYLAEPDA